MKIVLVGASGFVGGFILKEALGRGHAVTAIIRHPEKLTGQPKLSIVKGDVLDEGGFVKSISGHDIVISAFNPGWNNPDIYRHYVRGIRAIIKGVKKSRVKRLLVVGGAGSLEIKPGLQLVDTPEFPAQFKDGALGAREALNILKEETELEWTLVSPSITLQPGERTGKFRLGTDQLLFDGKGESTISTQDLAMAVLNEAEKPQFIRKRFTVGY